MAELILVDEWAEQSPLATHLQDTLPDDYYIVLDPTIRGRELDGIVVGPRGLVVLHIKDWVGEVHPARSGPWRACPDTGPEVRHPNPADRARQARAALRAFLEDEFPKLQPEIDQLLVLTNPGATLMHTEPTEPRAIVQDDAADAILSMPASEDEALLDDDVREALAVAFRDRRLTATQRASEPFVFRGGGLFGSGKKVWTVKAAIRHMDRHPDDGIFHLDNGTLARWLSEQGAEHLAELAREVTHHRRSDQRIPLELFLIGSGLVRRPRLEVRPRRASVGFVLAGETRRSRLVVRKGRGRGYLFGSLHTSEPWLHVDPSTFAGPPQEALVTADTETLPISRKPWEAQILIESSASAEPISVVARLRVMAMPSPLDRYLLRPLAGAITAGLLGAGLGYALGRWGLGAPGWFGQLGGVPPSFAATLAVVVGLFWALLGGIRGWFQRLAWPVSHATWRWLSRTLIWAVALALLALAAYWAWQRVEAETVVRVPAASLGSIVLSAAALAIVPAVIGEIGAAREAEEAAIRPKGRSLLRPILLGLAGVALVLLLAAGLIFLGPVWQRMNQDGTLSSAQQLAAERWAQWEASFNEFIDGLIIRYYDNRPELPF